MVSSIPRPIVKWAGGKGKLLPDLIANMPSSFNNYYEPFFGGGAFFFYLISKGLIQNAVISDLNDDLIGLYKVVRDQVEDLISELSSERYKNEEAVYYKIRAEEPTDPVKRAARFIYLNRTCYNGLYRVNSEGKFNVPFGKYKNPRILDAVNLRAVSQALKNVTLLSVDFEKAVATASKGDFVYFDPPYAPLTSTANFTSYTDKGFGTDEQQRLARVFRRLDKRGCYVLESNSATDIIRELYGHYTIVEVYASRAISSDATTRGKIAEFLIRNYDVYNPQRVLDEF